MAAHDPALRVYAILDAESCTRRGLDLFETASALHAGGVRLLQYRDKPAEEATYVRNASKLRNLLPDTFLLLNDHAHLVQQIGADGVHVGQTDRPLAEARELIGSDCILGISTHTADQALIAAATEADYLAIGPVFATTSKQNPEPAVGLCGVQAARAVTQKPLVAIGGIGLGEARAVEMAGADCVALISALLTDDPRRTAQDFLERLR